MRMWTRDTGDGTGWFSASGVQGLFGRTYFLFAATSQHTCMIYRGTRFTVYIKQRS